MAFFFLITIEKKSIKHLFSFPRKHFLLNLQENKTDRVSGLYQHSSTWLTHERELLVRMTVAADPLPHMQKLGKHKKQPDVAGSIPWLCDF